MSKSKQVPVVDVSDTFVDTTPKSVPTPHLWEPNFSNGEPSIDSRECGACGRTDDRYHTSGQL